MYIGFFSPRKGHGVQEIKSCKEKDHIWKDTKIEFLRICRELDGGKRYGVPTYSNFKYYALYQECVKCKEIKITEKRIQQLW